MEDFDLMNMLKTPLFMGTSDTVIVGAETVDINANDQLNNTLKNVLIVRTFTFKYIFDALNQFLKSLMV
jgi:hypothetical protein